MAANRGSSLKDLIISIRREIGLEESVRRPRDVLTTAYDFL